MTVAFVGGLDFANADGMRDPIVHDIPIAACCRMMRRAGRFMMYRWP